MPYVSKKQEAWAHTKTGMKALGGQAKVSEWDKASKGMMLPNAKLQASRDSMNTRAGRFHSEYSRAAIDKRRK
jgi:hypothetical protein